MSRYEFAVAIARIEQQIIPEGDEPFDPSPYARKSALSKYALKKDIPGKADLSRLATKSEVNDLRRLVDEFRDELAALGVDVDALKRDIAALCARVDAIEAELERVRLTGDANVFAVATSADKGTVFDLDERQTESFNDAGGDKNTMGRTIGVVRDFDLDIVGRASEAVTAVATINYGNYLNYLGVVDDYVGGARPTSKNDPSGLQVPGQDFVDGFFPYYLYIDMVLGAGDVQVGRFPLQFTPYTLKKVDVDSYTSILKTDDGNYPVDGIKIACDFGGVDITLFAVKHDENTYLRWGLASQTTAGLYDNLVGAAVPGGGPVNDVGGHAIGGLEHLIAQSAGVRTVVGTPWKGNLGLTFIQAWSEDAWTASASHDQARVYGADLNVPFGTNLSFVGSWTRSDALASDRVPAATDVDDDNTAWDARINAGLGRLGIGAGYKRIERNFTAAGAWDKIGRWTNPANIKGPYVDISYPLSSKLRFVADGEFLEMVDATAFSVDYEITKAEGGLRWGFSKTNSLDLGYQWVNFDHNTTGIVDSEETYLTIGWAHEMTPNSGFKVAYQFINYNHGNSITPYGTDDYRGGLGVVQFGANF